MTRKNWALSEVALLKENYLAKNIHELKVLFPDRSARSIRMKALNLGICRVFPKADVEILLDNSYISCYWLGFLAADGHFKDDTNTITLALHIRDLGHLNKFAEYIKYDNIKTYPEYTPPTCLIKISNKEIFNRISSKYNLHTRKTFNPIDLTSFNPEQLLVFTAGFIDGDGCISKIRYGNQLNVTIHSSWLPQLQLMAGCINQFTDGNACTASINNEGYAHLYFSQKLYLGRLKDELDRFQVPLMSRKWDKLQASSSERAKALRFPERK
jgi:hypothetical protein